MTALAATVRHARYVIGENPVTGLAFALFVLIVLVALVGPYVVPIDPLASDTVEALKSPSLRHWNCRKPRCKNWRCGFPAAPRLPADSGCSGRSRIR